jgi:hypothetical protein
VSRQNEKCCCGLIRKPGYINLAPGLDFITSYKLLKGREGPGYTVCGDYVEIEMR